MSQYIATLIFDTVACQIESPDEKAKVEEIINEGLASFNLDGVVEVVVRNREDGD